MSDQMKEALKLLQQVIIEEHPNAVEATIKYSQGAWVDVSITERGGCKL